MKGGRWIHRLDGPATVDFRRSLIEWCYQDYRTVAVYGDEWAYGPSIKYYATGDERNPHAPTTGH